MDIVSHALWGGTIIRKKPYLWWAFFFGAAPDILGSGPGFLYLLFSRHILWSSATWPLLPQILKDNYFLWHGLFAAAIVSLAIFIIRREAWFLILPYLLHSFVDIFTHQADPLSRLFSPFVSYDSNRVLGLNWWESAWIWWLTTALLTSINLLIAYKNRKFRH